MAATQVQAATNFVTAGSPLTMTALATFLNNALASVGRLKVDLVGVNFNAANADNAIAINLPTGFTRWKVDSVIISGASGTLTTATCGLFTAAAAGGVGIVPTGTAITVSNNTADTNNNMQALALFSAAATTAISETTVYFRTQTAEGAAATGNVSIILTPLP
jgi:diacylglycerol kinase family enzyme